MKEYISGVIKNLIISILVIACLLLILALVFYDKISLSKEISEVEEYYLTEEMQEEIETSELENSEEVVINYHIDAADLKKNKDDFEYFEGKNHPFAVTSDYTPPDDGTSTKPNNGQGGFYEDDGIK